MTISIDGISSDSFTNDNVGSITLSTSDINDTIVVCIQTVVDVGTALPYVNTITGGGLFFKKRGISVNTFGTKTSISEVWFTHTPGTLASQVFDIILLAIAETCALFAFAANSPDENNPFDLFFTVFGANPLIISDETGSSSLPGSGPLEPLGSNNLVLGFRFSITDPGGEFPGAGFTTIGGTDVTGAHIYVEYKVAPDPFVTYTPSETNLLTYWTFFGDVLTESINSNSEDIHVRIIPIQAESNLFIALEIDIYDRYNVTTTTVRICNRGPLFDGSGNQFLPNLEVPILLGVRIGADVYGQRLKGEVAGGDIIFSVHDLEDILNLDRYHWINREFRIYLGTSSSGVLSDLELIYTGVVNDLTHDFIHASIKTTDKSNLLNKPILTEVYDDTFPVGTIGKVKPKLFGKVIGLEPVLENQLTSLYRITILPLSGDALDDVTELRVGGIPWDKVSAPPGPGQWSVDLVNGTVTLGSDTQGGAVRCDAQVPGYGSYYTGDLLTEVITLAGGVVNSESERFFSANHDDRVGYWTGTDSLNVLDLIDEITYRQGGWWSDANGSGDILYKPLTYPSGPFVSGEFLYLSQNEIDKIQQTKVIPAIWRIRTEYAPNWTPISQFFEGVTDADRNTQSKTGIIAASISDDFVKTLDPAAGDIYLRTLCWESYPAYVIGLRLFSAWKVERRLFDITAFCDPSLVKIYTNVNIRYGFLNLTGLAHSAVKSVGGGANQFQIWG